MVVDDQSTDKTPEILSALKEELPLVRVLRLDSLPEGWMGKTHAVARGAAMATGEWLLFTDADTVHLPGSLAEVLQRAEDCARRFAFALARAGDADVVGESCHPAGVRDLVVAFSI